MRIQLITLRPATSKIRFRTFKFGTIEAAFKFVALTNVKVIDVIVGGK